MSLANDFKNNALFAEVRSDKSLERKFKITKTPAFVYVTDPANYVAEKYTGEYKKDQMSNWIQKYALKKFKASNTDSAAELSIDIISTGPCSKADSNFCLILFYEYSKINDVKELARELNEKFSEDPINVYILNKNSVCGTCVLGNEYNTGDVFLIRSKRNKFMGLGYKVE